MVILLTLLSTAKESYMYLIKFTMEHGRETNSSHQKTQQTLDLFTTLKFLGTINFSSSISNLFDLTKMTMI